jgi:hypothetical protein
VSVTDTDPGLRAALREEPAWLPTEHDWSFQADDAEGGFNRYGWGRADQGKFDQCWDGEAESLADELIATYGAAWPWVMPRLALARQLRFARRVRELAERREVGQKHYYRDRPDEVYELAMMYGSFDHVRQRRGPNAWPPAPHLICPICGGRFWSAILSPWMIRQYGPARFCNRCCVRARNGRVSADRAEMIAGLRRLAAAIEGIPQQQLAAIITLAGMNDDRRDAVLTGLIVAPAPQAAKARLGGTWLRVLQASGLVEEAWRPARGTYCFATDGHPCRSLAERTVDDFLARNGIAHESEPRYPGSARRADWGLANGTFIEYAGLLADSKYAAEIDDKRRMAATNGVDLIVLVPEDLTNLEHALRRVLPDR